MKHFTIGRMGLALLATAVVCLSQAAVASAGKAPALKWRSSSGSFNYGTVQPGQTPSLKFTLENETGPATGPLTVTLSGSSAFTITSDTCSGTSLGREKECRVTVQYTPATSSDSAVLTATSKKGSASATLTGSKEPQSQIDCQSFGGTYGVAVQGQPVPWHCFGYTDTAASGPHSTTLRTDCFNEGANAFQAQGSSGTFDGFCE